MAESNSVFISYRRSTSSFIALAVYQDLTAHGIDTFYDIESMDAGQFDTFILNQIAARPYFLPILTPGSLERCGEPNDWLMRELQEAMRLKRVILPLHTPDFQFSDMDKFLLPDMARELKRFQAVELPHKYFRYAMQEVRDRYLKPVGIPTTAVPKKEESLLLRKLKKASAEPQVSNQQLDAQAYFERAMARAKNDFDGKIADYSEAIRLDPERSMAYNNRGWARHQKGDLNGALEDYTEAIRLDPNNSMAHNNIGSIYHQKKDLDSAVKSYDQAIRLDPYNLLAYANRAGAHYQKGNLEASIKDDTEILRLDPLNMIAYTNRAWGRFETGDLVGSLEDYQQAVRLDPTNSMPYNNRGWCRYKMGDLAGALEDCDKAIDLDSANCDAYNSRGHVRDALGDPAGAVADFQKALALRPDDAEAQFMQEYIARHAGA